MDFEAVKKATALTQTKHIWVMGIIAVSLLLLLVTAVVSHEIKEQEEVANDIVVTSSIALTQHFGGRLDQINQTLSGLDNIWQLGHERDGEMSDKINQIMHQRKEESPFLLNLTILDSS